MTSRLSAGLARASRDAATVNAARPPLKSIAPRPKMSPPRSSARERVDRPQLRLDADDVLVTGQQDRLGGRVGPQARDHVGLARRRRRDDLDLEAERLEPLAQELGHLRLVAGRVGRIRLDQLLKQSDDLAIGPVVLRARHPRKDAACDQERHQHSHQPARTHNPRPPNVVVVATRPPPPPKRPKRGASRLSGGWPGWPDDLEGDGAFGPLRGRG